MFPRHHHPDFDIPAAQGLSHLSERTAATAANRRPSERVMNQSIKSRPRWLRAIALVAALQMAFVAPAGADCGLIGCVLGAVGLGPIGKVLDDGNRELKKELRFYGDIDRGVGRAVNETFKWIERHPEEALVVALVVIVAAAACVDGCVVVVGVLHAESAAGAAYVVSTPVAVYFGDQKDRSRASSKTGVAQSAPSVEVRKAAAPDSKGHVGADTISVQVPNSTAPPKAPTQQEVLRNMEVLISPAFGALPKDPKSYTLVPGLGPYRALSAEERVELERVMRAAKTWQPQHWIYNVWPRHNLDYKNRKDWGRAYADFGNLVYGASGKVVKFSDRQLYAGGGFAQQVFPGSRALYNPNNGSFLDYFDPRRSNDWTFGDLREDHQMVKSGIQIHNDYGLIRTLVGESPFGLTLPGVRFEDGKLKKRSVFGLREPAAPLTNGKQKDDSHVGLKQSAPRPPAVILLMP